MSDTTNRRAPKARERDSQPTNLSDLPLDVILLVLRCLDIRDVVRLQQASKHLAFLLSSHAVWYEVLQQYITSGIAIVPLRERMSNLSTRDLIDAVAFSTQLRRTWTSSRPRRISSAVFTPPGHTQKLLRLAFFNMGDKRYALLGYMSAARTHVFDHHVLYCLNVGQPGSGAAPALQAKMELPDVAHLAINIVDSRATFIVGHTDPECEDMQYKIHMLHVSPSKEFSIDGDTGLPSFGFDKQLCFTAKGVPLVLSGDILAAGDKHGSVWLYDIVTGTELYELAGQRSQGNETARVMLLSDTVIVFGYEKIRVYSLPEPFNVSLDHPLNFSAPRHTESSDNERSLRPTVVHTWRWGLEMLTVAPFLHTHASPATSRRPAFNIFVRYRSWYPWPINMVHHYVLLPGADGRYRREPTLRLYTYSALDLFATSDAVLGRHGTVLWIDSWTEQGAVGGQRVAGKILHVAPPDDDKVDALETLNDVRLTDLDPHGVTYDRGTTMVFGTMERAEATKLALDEEAGRIAVGFADGHIEVWDYLSMAGASSQT